MPKPIVFVVPIATSAVASARIIGRLKAIHAGENRPAARAKADQVIEKLEAMKLLKAAQKLHESIDETLS